MSETLRARHFPFVPVPTAWVRMLSPQEGWVALAIATHADRAGSCWPSLRLLCEETGLSRSSVQRALKALVAKRVLSVTPRSRDNGATSSHLYVIDMTAGVIPPDPDDGGVSQGNGGISERHGGDVTQTLAGVSHRYGGGVTETHQELDPFDLDPNESDPGEGGEQPTPTPSVHPHSGNPEHGAPPVVWDRQAMQYESLPWEDTDRRIRPEFLAWMTDLWANDKPANKARDMALASIRKARRDETSYLATRDRWEQFQQHQAEKEQRIEAERIAAEEAAERARWLG